ncbi:hypothetical protein IT575_11125 [bacterium]|nr:hypothetical protein [bacterium]
MDLLRTVWLNLRPDRLHSWQDASQGHELHTAATSYSVNLCSLCNSVVDLLPAPSAQDAARVAALQLQEAGWQTSVCPYKKAGMLPAFS